MVRRGSKRITSRETASESPTYARAGTDKASSSSSRRVRGQSPGASQRKSSAVRPRRSRRSNNPWTESGSNHGANDDSLQSYSKLPVPTHWTTVSGKFNPNRSELGFDAKSNIAINVNSRYGGSTSSKSGISECSPSIPSDDSAPKHHKSKSKKKTSEENDDEIVEGKIEDPEERHRFHKLRKKAGIKKTLTFDKDWENSSTGSEVSEISIGNASYILDLAQQKETRKKDREEEALEEALELYGTWLTEGKTDDKNIFLMILHEVKKEQKSKYKKADKRHSALLDAALDEELKRREKLKEEEEKEKAKPKVEKEELEIIQPPEDLAPSNPLSPSAKSNSTRKARNYVKQSQSKISEIIEHETSQRNLTLTRPQNEANNESKDGSDCSDEMIEVIDVAERCTGYGPDGITPRSSGSKNSRRSIFSCMGGSVEDVMDPSRPRRKEDHQNYSAPIDPPKEDSSRMFSRLRRQLSEKQAEQWKEEEKSWRKNDHVETKEEQWWKKINDAKKGDALFAQNPASIDKTASTIPNSTGSTDKSKKEKLDSSTRSDPGSASKSSKEGKVAPTTGMLSTVEEKKKTFSLKKKKNIKANSELTETDDPKEKKKKKKNEKKSNDSGNAALASDDDAQKSQKKKTEKKLNVTEQTVDDNGGLKSPKKKKKKKDKVAEGDESYTDSKDDDEKKKIIGGPHSILVKKKKDKPNKDGSRSGRALGFVDNADSRSVRSGRSTKGKKKKSNDTSGKCSVVGDKKKKKKVNKSEELPKETEPQKISKKKKKKTPSSTGSSSQNAVLGESTSMDWTDRCIMKTRSETTNGSETVLTMESALQ